MPALEHQRHEMFVQAIHHGVPKAEAYLQAGYEVPYASAAAAATRLLKSVKIQQRLQEFKARVEAKVVLSKQYVVEALLENAEKALGRKPVKIGKSDELREVYVYRGDVANRAIQLAGLECGMFIEKQEVKHINLYDKMTDDELILELSNEARKLLAYTPPEKPENSGD